MKRRGQRDRGRPVQVGRFPEPVHGPQVGGPGRGQAEQTKRLNQLLGGRSGRPGIGEHSLVGLPFIEHGGRNMIAEAGGFQQEEPGIGRRPVMAFAVARPIGKRSVGHLETPHFIDGRLDIIFDGFLTVRIEPQEALEIELRKNGRQGLFKTTVRKLNEVVHSLFQIERRNGGGLDGHRIGVGQPERRHLMLERFAGPDLKGRRPSDKRVGSQDGNGDNVFNPFGTAADAEPHFARPDGIRRPEGE